MIVTEKTNRKQLFTVSPKARTSKNSSCKNQ